MARHLLRKKLH